MSEQAELDKIILQLLGREEYIDEKTSIIIYDTEEIVKLDLSNLNLEELPDGFFDNFTQLRELDLSNNNFNKLPEHIFRELTELKRLNMSYMINPTNFGVEESVTLPEAVFKSLKKLETLDLSGNQLEVLPDTIFSNLFALEALDLSYNLLAILPPSIGSLVNLEQLYLDSNFLPVELGTEFTTYQETQEFLTPFNQEWMATHESLVSSEVNRNPVEDELKKAFSALEDLFD